MMARPLRIEYSGAFYHVINRGNAGQAIFKSKRDREKFLDYMAKMVERYGVRIHCYCMMSNHYHLLVETPEANLSQSIQWLNVSYAMYFNVKRDRRGHLFQGRFKAILVEADEYLKHLSRYIHLNPIRVKMVDSLVEYPWSSYRAFVGKDKIPDWLSADWILEWFGKNRKAAQGDYQDFVETIAIENIENPSSDIVGGLILGSREFADWVRDSFLKNRSENDEITGLSDLKPRPSIQNVINCVAAHYKCPVGTIQTKGLKKNQARDVAIYLCRECTGEKAIAIGTYFGAVKGQAISMGVSKIRNDLKGDKRLKKVVNKLTKRLLG